MRWEISKKSKLSRIAIKNEIFQENKNQDNQIFQLFIKKLQKFMLGQLSVGLFSSVEFCTKFWDQEMKMQPEDRQRPFRWLGVRK